MNARARRKENPQVRDLMSYPPVTVPEEMSLATVAELFLERGLSRVPVTDASGRAVGIVAKTDLLEEALETPDFAEPGEARVQLKGGVRAPVPGTHVEPEVRVAADVMTRDPITVPADAPVWMAASLLTERGLHGLPVVDPQGRVVGMISSTDVVRWVSLGR